MVYHRRHKKRGRKKIPAGLLLFHKISNIKNKMAFEVEKKSNAQRERVPSYEKEEEEKKNGEEKGRGATRGKRGPQKTLLPRKIESTNNKQRGEKKLHAPPPPPLVRKKSSSPP